MPPDARAQPRVDDLSQPGPGPQPVVRRPERLLLLGGTREAAELARTFDRDPRIEAISSLAGRTRTPTPVPGALRRGGFGGAEGLAAWLRAEEIGLVVDATHPYAEVISAHAARACEAASVPRLALLRAPWTPGPGDRWTEVPDAESAARALPALGERVLLTIGSRGLEPFLRIPGLRFVVRAIEAPDLALDPARVELLRARGPFDLEDELRLLKAHAIDVLVSKNSGGSAVHAKLAAARILGLPVLMIARPPRPPGTHVDSVAGALSWVEAELARRGFPPRGEGR